jgi:hypothetical protein
VTYLSTLIHEKGSLVLASSGAKVSFARFGVRKPVTAASLEEPVDSKVSRQTFHTVGRNKSMHHVAST